MLINTHAIVISALKYAEADLIVRCFTQTSGLKSYLLRGVLKSRKGKFKASMFQPFTQLELVAKHKDKGNLEYLQDARLLVHYQSLHTNVVKSTMVLFLSEILRNAIQEEEQNEPLYFYLEQAFNFLDKATNISNFHLLFLLGLTRYLGFYPDDPMEGSSCFNLLEGIFQDEKTNEYCIDGPNFILLKQLLGTNFDDLDHIKLTRSARANFLTMLLAYYRLHIESFRNPQSLSVLNEIFH
jgi:DNA repair protein RecO (recombination protein O)